MAASDMLYRTRNADEAPAAGVLSVISAAAAILAAIRAVQVRADMAAGAFESAEANKFADACTHRLALSGVDTDQPDECVDVEPHQHGARLVLFGARLSPARRRSSF